MLTRVIIALSILINVDVPFQRADAAEPHAEVIFSKIIKTKQAILAADESTTPAKYVFLAIWDFDGTILHGDCSEGLKIDNKPIYKGLAQLCIEEGHSEIYPAIGGFDRFWKDYQYLEQSIGEWLAYPYIPQMLRGSSANDVSRLAQKHFTHTLLPYYFDSSVNLLNRLEKNDIQNHIISASADLFVDAAAATLNLPVSRFNGIDVQIQDGVITDKLIYPVTWSDGKTEKLKEIIKKTQSDHPGKQVVVLAGFGNSFNTDGAFMKYVASQHLPAGKPISVMINGGETPADYQNLFIDVQQTKLSTK